MVELKNVPEELRLARGDYATVRSVHEDAIKMLQGLCGQMQSFAAQILRKAQPESDETMEGVQQLLDDAHSVLCRMIVLVADIELLSQQRAKLKKIAWPKKTREHWEKPLEDVTK